MVPRFYTLRRPNLLLLVSVNNLILQWGVGGGDKILPVAYTTCYSVCTGGTGSNCAIMLVYKYLTNIYAAFTTGTTQVWTGEIWWICIGY